MPEASSPSVAVVGGGVAGLAAAFEASREGARVVLLEETDRLGGKVLTEHIDGFLVEGGPDGFLIGKESVLDLATELGITDRVIPTRSEHAGTWVWWDGRLHPIPEGLLLMLPVRIGPILGSSLLSWRGKLRLLAEPLVPPRRSGEDESLADFVHRRLGSEVLERIAEPLVAGIHGARPETMSLRASFPRLLEMEREHRSLLRAARRIRTTRPAGATADLGHLGGFRGGMGELVDTLAARLEGARVRLEAPVTAIIRENGRYRVHLAEGDAVEVDSVVLAVPARVAARLLPTAAPDSAAALEEIETVDLGSATLAYRRDDLPMPLRGHGFVVPTAAGRDIEGVSYPSRKWPERTPDRGFELLRVFVSGEAVRLGERAVLDTSRRELGDMLGITAQPVLARVHLWPGGLHRYTLGHLERIERARAGLSPGLFLAGGAYEGIGLNECVRTGREAGLRAARLPVGRPAANREDA